MDPIYSLSLAPEASAVVKAAPASFGYGGTAGPGLGNFLDAYKKHRAPGPAELLAECLNTAYACTALNADGVASTPLRLYVRTRRGETRAKFATAAERMGAVVTAPVKGKRLKYLRNATKAMAGDAEAEEVLEHPLLSLLENPNPDEPGLTLFDILHLVSEYLDVVGRAHLYADRSGPNGTPRALWILPAHHVTEESDGPEGRIIDRYRYGSDTYEPEDIVSFRFPDPAFPYKGGKSPLRACIERVRIERKLDAQTGALLDNAGRPDAVFTPKGDTEGNFIGADEAKRLQLAFRQRFAMAGRGGILVSEVPGSLEPLTWPMNDIIDAAREGVVKTNICNAYGVPDGKLNRNSANRASADTADYAHAKDAILPRCRRIEPALNQLCRMYDPSGRLFLAFDNPVPEDKEAEREETKVTVSMGGLTVNERREAMGMDPVEGGDVRLATGTLTAIDPVTGMPVPQNNPLAGLFGPSGASSGAGAPATLPNGQDAPALQPEAVPPLEQPGAGQQIQTTEAAVLNGAQITAATAIVVSVAAGEIPRDAGIGQLVVLFNLKPEQAEQIMGSAGTNKPTTPNPNPKEEAEREAEAARLEAQANAKPNPGDVAGAKSMDDAAARPAVGNAVPVPGIGDAPASAGGHQADAVGLPSDVPIRGKAVINDPGTGLARALPQGGEIADLLRRTFAEQARDVLGGIEGKAIEDVEQTFIDSLGEGAPKFDDWLALHAWKRAMDLRTKDDRQDKPKPPAPAPEMPRLPRHFIDVTKWNGQLAESARPLIEVIVKEQGNRILQRVGASPDVFAVFERNIPKAVENLALKFAESTNATTSMQLDQAISRLRDELSAGLETGDTRVELRKRVEGVFEHATKERAQVIAQTEASRAAHQGELISAKESGVVSGKYLIASADACPVCEAVAAKGVMPLDAPMLVSGDGPYGVADTPPIHPSCQCSEGFTVNDDATA